MINDFINFVQELFPSISPYTKEKVKDAIKQFDLTGKKQNFFLYQPLDHLVQGDIIEMLPFTRYNMEGNREVYKTKGILISNSCDADNDDTIVFAPLFPLEKINLDIANIKNNLNYRLLYFPDPKLENYVADLSLLNSYNKKLIENSINIGKITKIVSLSQLGYYFFICKLTVHLLRPEDIEVQDYRKIAG